MKLRKWQTECVASALRKYNSNKRHFMCLATPGAGKTIMAAEIAAHLLKTNQVDLVLCFSPSVVVSSGIRRALETRTHQRFDGKVGAKGGSYTYHSMAFLDGNIWSTLLTHRVFVIFDEIHHCAGSVDLKNANSWGEGIISNIQNKAAFTLALSGTPWRSDNFPIALAEYSDKNNQIVCDYKYGLSDAIRDGVCKTPRIIVIDNDKIELQSDDESTQEYDSFKHLLAESDCNYHSIINNVSLIKHTLIQASLKLTEVRIHTPNAGGLVVAASVAHAKKILNIITNDLKESAVIVTYQEDSPANTIHDFSNNTIRWIVSVGMVSEGTDIPRLQVCCHLTRIKTELYFRQILGRVLRINGKHHQEGFLYMPAEPRLIEYAQRIATDIPEDNAVVRICNANENHTSLSANDSAWSIDSAYELMLNDIPPNQNHSSIDEHKRSIFSSLISVNEENISIFGRFKLDILALNLSQLE